MGLTDSLSLSRRKKAGCPTAITMRLGPLGRLTLASYLVVEPSLTPPPLRASRRGPMAQEAESGHSWTTVRQQILPSLQSLPSAGSRELPHHDIQEQDLQGLHWYSKSRDTRPVLKRTAAPRPCTTSDAYGFLREHCPAKAGSIGTLWNTS